MRALQLPPEAWLRLGGYNSSITHLQIRGSGSVSLVSFGDHGHLSLDETTFGMYATHRPLTGLGPRTSSPQIGLLLTRASLALDRSQGMEN
jgi:hypothetical protein